MNKDYTYKNVAVSPLDWGLGHTSRIVPVIKYLQKKRYNVYVFCNETQKQFLQNELSNINFINLKGYNVDYSKSDSQIFKILFQVPKILYRIIYEHFKLKIYDRKFNFDKIISDNRYGFFLKKKTSVIITHQTYIKTPFRFTLPEKLLNKINTWIINKFSICLIPDFEDYNKSLAGDLSHKNKNINRLKYIGILSRFTKECKKTNNANYVLAILSGPKTQKDIFEKSLIKKFSKSNKNLIIINGSSNINATKLNNITIKSTVNSKELFTLICNSEYVITRSGYSSIMDLSILQKKAILIATPGQTEQEYLIKHNKNNRLFECFLSLEQII